MATDEPLDVSVEYEYVSEPDRRYEYNPPFGSDDRPSPFVPKATTGGPDVPERYPYLDAGESLSGSDSPTIEPPETIYDQSTDSADVIVDTRANSNITGTTNLAPESDARIEFVTPTETARIIETADVDIDDDGSFSFEPDMSNANVGDELDTEFYTQSELRTNGRALVVENVNSATFFEIVDAPNAITIESGDPITEEQLPVTVENTGIERGQSELVTRVDGEIYNQQTVTVEGESTETFGISTPGIGLSPGEYRYSVTTENDEYVGTVIVTDASPGNLTIE